MAASGEPADPERSPRRRTGVAAHRRAEIVAVVARDGGARVADLALRFAVSEMTIRRDLDVLAGRGEVRKVHGGALPAGRRTRQPDLLRDRTSTMAEKQAIAEVAGGLVEPGTSVALSAGTTTWLLAGVLARVPGLTVVTNSADVARHVHDPTTPGQQVILTGGTFRTPSDALVGPVAAAGLRSLHVDQLFLGVHGVDREHGLTTSDVAEAETDRAMMRRAARVVVLADRSKFGTVGLAHIAELDAADVVVSDEGLPEVHRAAVDGCGVELLLAAPVARSG